MLYERPECIWYRAAKLHLLLCDRMGKREAEGMERDAADRIGHCAVFLVAYHRTSQIRQMHTYLVLAPGIEHDLKQRMRFVRLEDLIPRDCMLGLIRHGI